jgi:hypothetical protein
MTKRNELPENSLELVGLTSAMELLRETNEEPELISRRRSNRSAGKNEVKVEGVRKIYHGGSARPTRPKRGTKKRSKPKLTLPKW